MKTDIWIYGFNPHDASNFGLRRQSVSGDGALGRAERRVREEGRPIIKRQMISHRRTPIVQLSINARIH
jgi:hypothetical protein